MKQKTQEYVQFINENHRDFGGKITGAMCAKELGISQGRVSQLIKVMKCVEQAIVQGPVEVVEAASA